MRSIFLVLTSVFVAHILALPNISFASAAEDGASQNDLASVESQPGSLKSIALIAREMTNPLASFYSFAYQYDHRSYQGSLPGAGDQTFNVHTFQPVIPFRQKNGKGFVFRFALPYYENQPIYWYRRGYEEIGNAEWRIRQEDPTLKGEGYWRPTHGHTDAVSTDLVYGGVSDSGVILQYGIAGILPTSSDTSNARQQLILGPEVNIGKMADWGTYGALISHVFDVAEKEDKGTPDTTQTTIQAYFSYEFSRGWQLISNPTITYDWEADSGNKLALPIGGGVAKTTRIGQMPLRLTAEIQKYVATTDRFSTDWLFRLTVVPVLWTKQTRN